MSLRRTRLHRFPFGPFYVVDGDGAVVIGTRLAETAEELQIAQPGGAVAKIRKSNIKSIEPMSVSLMPVGLDKTLTAEELRDLMTYLLTEPSAAAPARRPSHGDSYR